MKTRILITLLAVLSLHSCGFFKSMEWRQAEKFAVMIEDDMNSQNVDGLVTKFDAPLFARRLGKEFTRLSVPERSYGFGLFKKLFRSNMEGFTADYSRLGINTVLIGLSEKDGVYRAVYSVLDEEEMVRNYLVFYFSSKEDNRFQIANYYSVYAGFSFGQSMKELTKMMNDSSNFDNEIASVNRSMEIAMHLYRNAQFEQAYQILDELSTQEKRLSLVATLKLSIADQIGGTKAVEEFNHMKSIVPNEQSKLFYECLLQSFNNATLEELEECGMELELLLLES